MYNGMWNVAECRSDPGCVRDEMWNVAECKNDPGCVRDEMCITGCGI